MRRDTQVALLAVLMTACGLSTGPGALGDGPEEVTLAVSDHVVIPGIALRVQFLSVEEDSRCPIEAVCVWEGNVVAAFALTAGAGGTHLEFLNTAVEPRSVDYSGVRVTLVAVSPLPHVGLPIPAEDYVVTLRLEPIEL